MDKLMNKFFRSSMITSGFLMVLGILLLFQSEITILSISYVLGAILIAIGVLAIIRFIKNTNNSTKSELDIIYGVVTVILGLLIIQNPQAIASIIPIILGITIIINSATKLQYSFELKANKNNQWKATMLVSIISTICGVVLLFNPFKGAVLLTQVVGIFIIIYSVLDIISTIAIKKNVADIKEAIENSITDAEIIEEVSKKNSKKKKQK